MKKKIVLLLLILTAFFLRIYQIDKNPPSLNWDEVSHGFNAYSLFRTGRDEWGVKLPLIFRAYGDQKLPLYLYLSTPAVGFFGLNPFSVRLVSVLSGVGLVWLVYLIAQKIVGQKAALFAAFLMALSPWGLFVSRIGVEANLGAFLFALGMYWAIAGLTEEKQLLKIALVWGLALFAYNSARVLVPVFAVLFLIIGFKTRQLRKYFLPGLVFLVFFIPVVWQVFNKTGSARFETVNLIDQGVINRIIEKRQKSNLSAGLAKVVYNRPVYFLSQAVSNYFSNFSPNYLFFRGGSHYQFSQPNHELLFLVTAPFLLLGVFRLLLQNRVQERLILLWLFLGFIPSAITKDAPHVLRSLFVLPAIFVAVSQGLVQVTEKLKNGSVFKGRLVVWAVVLAVLVSFGRWWRDYWTVYPKTYAWSWQYGYQEAVAFVKEHYTDYQYIYFTKKYGEPHEFVLFYWPWDPNVYQSEGAKDWDYHADWYWINRLDKIIFENDWEIKEKHREPLQGKQSPKILLVTSPGNYPEGWKVIKTVYFLNGSPVFEILENM